MIDARALEVARFTHRPLIALDASTAQASVATVGFVPGEIRELEPDAGAMPSESLAACVAGEFERADRSASEIGALVVGLGPGSFTGLRVGLALVKGLAVGAQLPIFGVSSFALMAARFPNERVEFRMNAQRQELYAAVYSVDSQGWPTPIVFEHTTTLERWTPDPAATRIVGDLADAERVVPRALAGIALCAERIFSHDSDDVHTLAPRYLKVSEAERNLSAEPD